jgi:hypothetical protein
MRPASTEEEVSNQLQKILRSENTAFRKHRIQKTPQKKTLTHLQQIRQRSLLIYLS